MGKKLSLILSLSGGVLVLFSLLHIVRVLAGDIPLIRFFNVPPDVIGSAILMLSGYLLIAGGLRSWKGRGEGIAYSWVGWMTAALMSSVSALILASHAFSSFILSSEDLKDWTAADDLVPGLYLGALLVLLFPVLVLGSRSAGAAVEEGEGI